MRRTDAIVTGLLALALAGCNPELRGLHCGSNAECATDEVCNLERQRCESAADRDQDVVEELGGDAPDAPLDLGDAELSDDSGDAATDADGDAEASCPFAGFSEARLVRLAEPCREPSPAFRAAHCAPGGDAYTEDDPAAGVSSWRRAGEPVDVPLVNGRLDGSVRGFWPLDGDLADRALDPHPLEGPVEPEYLPGRLGQLAGAVDLDGQSEGLALRQDLLTGRRAWTVALWFRAATLPSGVAVLVNREPIVFDLPQPSVTIALDDGRLYFATGCGLGLGCKEGSSVAGLVQERTWHHVALVSPGDGTLVAYLDGSPLGPDELTWTGDGSAGSLPQTSGWSVGRRAVDASTYTQYFEGRVDELLLLDRGLTAWEVRTYVESGLPYGESFVPGAQPDYEDARLAVAEAEPPQPVLHELVGVRPFGDAALGDVEAYWSFDDGAQDVLGRHDGSTPPEASLEYVAGRFGESSGALRLGAEAAPVLVDANAGLYPSEFTLELWLRLDHLPEAPVCLVCSGTPRSPQSLGLVLDPGDGALRFTCDGVGPVDETAIVDVSAPGVLGQLLGWHHLAVVNSAENTALFFDGVLLPVEFGAGHVGGACQATPLEWQVPLVEAEGWETPEGALDELILHRRALTPADLATRTAPPLPALRFFAETEADPDSPQTNFRETWHYRGYELVWDSAGARREPLVVPSADGPGCAHLLSQCAGFAGWWRFDSAVADLFPDASELAAWARPNDLAPFRLAPTPGVDGFALPLEGVADWAEVPGYVGVDLQGSWTVELWFNRLGSDAATDVPLVGRSAGADGGSTFDVVRRADEGVSGGFRVAGGGEHRIDAPQALDTDAWTSVALSRAYDGETGALHLYRGFDEVSGSPLAVSEAPGGAGAPVRLGTDPDALGGAGGALDSVRIANRALEPWELLHYPIPRVGFGPIGPGPCP